MVAVQPRLTIHGSASFFTDKEDLENVRRPLYSIVNEVYQPLKNQESVIDNMILGH
ncbi:isoaspartyl peptidase/L-asparaginase [cyanobacterium endosymbiont of Rhopalodia gibberula]|uniref:isoaspartyl peptidase/L-asparaginase n=1 Tax=cyanobacterium endosymbiont of Rhopalodia gibberula TaxID=1763363 RepID=UPI0011AB8D92|nr:isoaspartyl peptidase/L-asparaginase [cyanobacterium endosymbiont of Rhopalodia gibberula]